jgi:hypothetical protein
MKTHPSHRVHQVNLAVILAFGLSLIALLALPPRASAVSFSFSTGAPDGLIGTLSRVGTAAQIQTETADDFVLTENTLINQATFTGLLPSGASLSSITNVEVEIYRVFPSDSANPPSAMVPTRVNSPADNEIGSATRDSSGGSLHFTATLVNPIFNVANSVVNGINKSLTPFTGGEGPVNGEEVTITVTFNPPILLLAGHYFFRPEVFSTSGNFLWLSAPKPVAPPLFVGDLQSWIRNDNLAPDWLRIGTDITAQGPFNASFSLFGETDQDADGVPDSLDQCPDTPAGDIVNAQGCSIEQLVPCAGPASGGTWKNHGQYVSSIAHAAQDFVTQGLISGQEKGQIVSAAARSNCGAKAKKHQH